MDRLVNGLFTDVHLLLHVGSFLSAVDLSRAMQVCKRLGTSFKDEYLWKRLCEDNGIKNGNQTRTRGAKLFRQLYIESACSECSQPSCIVFSLFSWFGNCANRQGMVNLCVVCVQEVRMHDSVSARRAAGVLPRYRERCVRRDGGISYYLRLLDVIPTTKDIAKAKKPNQGYENGALIHDHLINAVSSPPPKAKKQAQAKSKSKRRRTDSGDA